MNPSQFAPDVVAGKLARISELLRHLDEMTPVNAAGLESDHRTRLAVERVVTQVIELAVDINTHVAVTLGRAAPQSYRDSFRLAAAQGLIEGELAQRLAPAAGLRNLLVHDYERLDLERFSRDVNGFSGDFGEYVRQAVRFEGAGSPPPA